MTAARPQRELINEVTVEHGPMDLLGRFFLKADLAARQRGVTLTFGSLDELVDANRRNRDSWLPLVATFDPDVGGITSDNSICVFGRNAGGEIVTTQAVRVFHWKQESFADACTNLTLFYADPTHSKGATEQCTVTAQKAFQVSGSVSITGAGWCRPDYRGKLMTCVFPRVTRALALTRWNPSFLTCVMSDKVVAGGLPQRAGWKETHWDIQMLNSPIGNLRLGFFAMDGHEFLSDLADFIEQFDTFDERVISNRRT